ncbi:Alpha/Beta hydrolase protein [Daldinia bambusicola]|nr:Alpha/Beta hydrolase protein [Daldinia bambusicola]
MSANLGNDEMSSAAETPEETPEETSSLEVAEHKLLDPDPGPAIAADDGTTASRPLIICFHGSGESCSPSWDALAHTLTAVPHRLRVLLYDRGILNPRPPQATSELREYLRSEGLKGPCVLVAHSYGGAFARTFLEQEQEQGREQQEQEQGENLGKDKDDDDAVQVVGMVLVETGQEGGLDPEVERAQYARRVLGTRPLSVVRGNSLMRQWADLTAAEASVPAGDELKREDLRQRREMLRIYDAADEQLKKKQLDLAAPNARKRYVRVPDCGHHVVRDRPDVVAREIAWVLENVGKIEEEVEMDGMGEENRREGRNNDDKGKMGDKIWEVKIKRIWKFCRGVMGKLLDKLGK